MLLKLTKYYLSLHFWSTASIAQIKKMQLKKFRELFEYAKKNSKFYREFYGDNGVLDVKIGSLDDIAAIPMVNKAMLRKHSVSDIMTCDMSDRIHCHSTSGSSGEPFRVAFNPYEDYTAHVRVFWALRKAGYRLTDKIVIITRYSAEEKFTIEKEISAIGAFQSKLKFFRREIISIYEPVDEIISKLIKTKARILWSTPSILQIIGNRLKEKKIKLDFPIVFLTSEFISTKQKELFSAQIGAHIVNLYGTIESPSLGFDFGLGGKFDVFPNSNYFEFQPVAGNDGDKKIGKVIITNLINKTLPIIRYDLNDLAEIDGQAGFGYKYIKNIIGRQDDIIKLGDGKYLAHHHAHEMFMDFHECEMFKFVKKPDENIILQLKIAGGQDKTCIEKSAHERWRKHFGDVSLLVEFVESFKINAQTGKFKNIENREK